MQRYEKNQVCENEPKERQNKIKDVRHVQQNQDGTGNELYVERVRCDKSERVQIQKRTVTNYVYVVTW